MRIAVVTTSYPAYEGDPAGHFVEAEVNDLRREGHDVHVIRPSPGGAFGWPGAAARIREEPLRGAEAAAWTVRATLSLRRFQPERVIAHWCVPSAFPIALGATGELEIVSHGGDVRLLASLPSRRVRAAIVRTIAARATRWRFVSEPLLESLAAKLPAEERRMLLACAVIAPSALELPDVRDEVLAKRSAVRGRLYVCAGRLVPSKRVDKVIDYVATNQDHRAEREERVLIVLGDGPERAHLERLARAWRIDVRFLGKTSRREALGWIGAADEVVHASKLEGLSTVVREAEHLGVPVTILS